MGVEIKKSLRVTICFGEDVHGYRKRAKPIVHKQDNHFKVCSLHAVVGSAANKIQIVRKRRSKDNNPL